MILKSILQDNLLNYLGIVKCISKYSQNLTLIALLIDDQVIYCYCKYCSVFYYQEGSKRSIRKFPLYMKEPNQANKQRFLKTNSKLIKMSLNICKGLTKISTKCVDYFDSPPYFKMAVTKTWQLELSASIRGPSPENDTRSWAVLIAVQKAAETAPSEPKTGSRAAQAKF